MTVCGFIHSPGFPTLIADCLVSHQDRPDLTSPSKINPANARSGLQLKDLATKRILLSPSCVVGFAGKAADIYIVARDLTERASSLDPDRPMRTAGDIVDAHLSNGRVVEMVGFDAFNGLRPVNIVAANTGVRVKTENFNECYFVGSGAHELANLVSQFDEHIT